PALTDGCVAGACACGNGPACVAGQTCQSGRCACTATSCPSGCCQGDQCTTPGLASCGLGGATCIDCVGMLAHRCTAGACRCGANASCDPGQRCASVSGIPTCVCDGASCPGGCCAGGTCYAATISSCGIAGNACVVCDTLTTDGCSASGICTCGGGAPCGA